MSRMDFDRILERLVRSHEEVSDINVTVGKPFQVEAYGKLIPVPLNPPIESITPFQAELFALNILGGHRRLLKDLVVHGSCDSSYQLGNTARFRVNVFSQRGFFSTVMRRLPTRVPSIEELGLPEAFHMMASEKNGIILVTGATGSGKSTSLAAVLREINEKDAVHVVTLEDPVEFVHRQNKATFNQRELGTDFDSFASGIRAALRQAPKVILVGEMRDRETVEIALSAAETGHLVLSTLHTVDAGLTVNRILGMFSMEEERQIRMRLSDTLRWVACQRLLPNKTGGRVAAFEIMGSNLRMKESILNGETEGKSFYEIIEGSRPFGMMTFDQTISELYAKEIISEETAMRYASRRSVVGRALDQIKSARGQKTTTIEGLSLDDEYGKRGEKKR